MTREMADRIAAALVVAWKQRVGHLEGHVLSSHDGVVVCVSGLPADDLNVALVEREPTDPVAALASAEGVFVEHGAVFGVEIERGRHPSVDRAVRERGLAMVFARPAMAIRALDLPPARPPDGVRIRRVTDPEGCAALVDIEVEVFGTERAVAERFAGPSLLSAEGLSAYVATIDDVAVGMAVASRHEGSVGVFGVATVPEARRRGIGAAMTALAIRDAPADLGWLQPTTMGRPLYLSMGFEDVAGWEVWVRRRSDPGEAGI
jgi:GNAT superfamily N-acetyltransferase